MSMPKTTHFSTDKDKIKLLIVCISYTINMVNMEIIQNVSQLCNLICRRDKATITYQTHLEPRTKDKGAFKQSFQMKNRFTSNGCYV